MTALPTDGGMVLPGVSSMDRMQVLQCNSHAAIRRRPNAASAPPLSTVQQRFNALLHRLEGLRSQLSAWSEALPRWRERYYLQAEPLLRRRAELLLERLTLLDQWHAGQALGKADRAFLSTLIGESARALVEAGYPEFEPLHERHGENHLRMPAGDPDAQIKQALAAHFGLDADELDDITPSAAAFERLYERMRQQQAHARERQQRSRSRRTVRGKPTQVAGLPPPSQPPSRELYRKLASLLHPDRESEPSERARKTGLMQRLNHAYRSGHLLGLIELQLEIGQRQPEQLQRMSDVWFAQYGDALETQLGQAQRELRRLEAAFRTDYGVTRAKRLDPQRLDALLAQIKRDVTETIVWLEQELTELREPVMIKRWLKRARESSRREHLIDVAGDAAW